MATPNIPPQISAQMQALLARLMAVLQPPDWFTEEGVNRLVLALNHVLAQNDEARARLVPLAGSVARLVWRDMALQLRATPAGLCEAAPGAAPDLTLTLADDAPMAFAKSALRRAPGDKPAVRIEGDAHFATELNWLAANVRWDADKDLRRVLSPEAAHVVREAGRAALQGLQGAAERVAAFAAAAQRVATAPAPAPEEGHVAS